MAPPTVREIETEQQRVCRAQGVEPVTPGEFEKVGIALSTLATLPLNGLRHPPQGDTCGWYIWGGEGELSAQPDFFQPLHVRHLVERCPDALGFLALPPGWRFLAADGVVDVWYDPSLLDVE